MRIAQYNNGEAKSVSGFQRWERSLRFYPLQVLMRRRWQLLACFLLVLSIAFLSMFLFKQKYQAIAQVQVIKDNPKGDNWIALLLIGEGDYFERHCELLHSQRVLAEAAVGLGLAESGATCTDTLITQLRSQVKTQPKYESQHIDIIGIGQSGEEAAAIANHVMKAFIKISAADRQSANKRVVRQIQEQIADIDKELQEIEKKLNQFRQKHVILDADSAIADLETSIAQIKTDRKKAQRQRLLYESEIARLKRIRADQLDKSSIESYLPGLNEDSITNSIYHILQQLRMKEAQLAQTQLPSHSELKNVRRQISEQQIRLRERQRVVLTLTVEDKQEKCNELVIIEDLLTQRIEEEKKLGIQLKYRFSIYEDMLAELGVMRQCKDDYLIHLRNFTLEGRMKGDPVVIVDAPKVPTKRIGISKTHKAISILQLGMIFSIVFVFALEKFCARRGEKANHTSPTGNISPSAAPWMYGPWAPWPGWTASGNPPTEGMANMEPEGQAALGRIGTIQLGGASHTDVAFASRCRIVHTEPSSPQADAFRQISVRLLRRFGDTHQSVVITSMQEQSGKTTCACNLALLLAQTGRKILLVDANPQGPDLQRVFACKPSPPETSEIPPSGEWLDQALQETDVPGLKVWHGRGKESWLYQADPTSLKKLDVELAKHFDWIFYDTGTLPDRLTGHLLQAIHRTLVVRSEKQGEPWADMIERIERAGAVCLGYMDNAPLESQQTKT